MPMGNPAAYAKGQAAAMGALGMPKPAKPPAVPGLSGVTTPSVAQVATPPGPKPVQLSGVDAASPAAPRLAPKMKTSAFSLSPDPDTRVQESRKDTVRQPKTNEDRRIATGIDPAFNYLATPSEADPYTTPRTF